MGKLILSLKYWPYTIANITTRRTTSKVVKLFEKRKEQNHRLTKRVDFQWASKANGEKERNRPLS